MPLGIAGVGVVGCSIGLRYRALHPQASVVGLDANAAHLALASERGAITGTANDLRNLAARSKIVVLATPVEAVVTLLRSLTSIPAVDRPALVIDVASVKACICSAGSDVSHFVGTHPMAGSELGGPVGAREDLFVGRPWAYVPTDDTEATAHACAFIAEMGAHALPIAADEHDALVARTSHLPQTLSTVLALHALREPLHGLYGQGLLDMLRLARSPDATWNDIYIANAVAIAEELRAYARELHRFADVVAARDRKSVSSYFRRANDAVRRLS